MSLLLRALDPQTERDLFQTAYNWRRNKRHVQPDRIPFEAFAADDPQQIVLGLFNGELIAVYFLIEYEPGCYDCHFTSQRGVPRPALLAGARQIIDWFSAHGMREMTAKVTQRNKPLRSFLESLGFEEEITPCQNDTVCSNLPAGRTFVRYVKR